MPEYRRGVARAAFERGDAARTPPSAAALNADDDVFVKETALLQEPHGGLRREFVDAKFTHADEITEAFGFLGFRKLQERVQTVNLAPRGWFAVLGECLQLRFDKFAQSAIFKAFNDGSGALRRHEEDTFAGNQTACIINFTEKRGFFNRRAEQSQRTNRGSAHVMGWHKHCVPNTKPQLNHQFPPR